MGWKKTNIFSGTASCLLPAQFHPNHDKKWQTVKKYITATRLWRLSKLTTTNPVRCRFRGYHSVLFLTKHGIALKESHESPPEFCGTSACAMIGWFGVWIQKLWLNIYRPNHKTCWKKTSEFVGDVHMWAHLPASIVPPTSFVLDYKTRKFCTASNFQCQLWSLQTTLLLVPILCHLQAKKHRCDNRKLVGQKPTRIVFWRKRTKVLKLICNCEISYIVKLCTQGCDLRLDISHAHTPCHMTWTFSMRRPQADYHNGGAGMPPC